MNLPTSAAPGMTADRTLTELDHVRLDRLLRRAAAEDRGGASPGHFRHLRDLLDHAQVVPSREVAPDVVTVWSQVLLRPVAATADEADARLTLCYPADAEPAAGFVSVLSPVGRALLGLRVGEVARWAGPDGTRQAAEVVALLFQPESSGDYTM